MSSPDPTNPHLLLGRLAVHYKVLDKQQVGAALKAFREAGGADFGAFLVERGAVPEATMGKLLRARQQYLEKQAATAPAATAPAPAPAAAATPVAAAPAPPAPGPAPATPSAAATQPLSRTSILDDAEENPITSTVKVQKVAYDDGDVRPTSEAGDLLHFDASTTMEDLLRQTRALEASDLHVHAQAPLRLRRNGSLVDSGPLLDGATTRHLVHQILDDEQRRQLEEQQQVDFSYSIPGVGRFRANAYKQQRGIDAVFRAIPAEPPTLEELGLPPELAEIASFPQGIVLFTGPAGCGKSSTMAAIVRMLNESKPDHIVTIEDPVEYVHPSAQCLVNQREVGAHTESFGRALRAALREDPDIIVIGELRDLETISLALTAAETGHLVFATLHTSSAIRTINRLLGVFPAEQQNQIRTMVSESLRAVISQRLVPRADGQGRVPAIEVLMVTRAVSNLIREQKTFQILSLMQTGSSSGMRLLDSSLEELVANGTITVDEARLHAEDEKRFV